MHTGANRRALTVTVPHCQWQCAAGPVPAGRAARAGRDSDSPMAARTGSLSLPVPVRCSDSKSKPEREGLQPELEAQSSVLLGLLVQFYLNLLRTT